MDPKEYRLDPACAAAMVSRSSKRRRLSEIRRVDTCPPLVIYRHQGVLHHIKFRQSNSYTVLEYSRVRIEFSPALSREIEDIPDRRSGSFWQGRHECLNLLENFAGIADDQIMGA